MAQRLKFAKIVPADFQLCPQKPSKMSKNSQNFGGPVVWCQIGNIVNFLSTQIPGLQFFEMAAMPFPCNGILLSQSIKMVLLPFCSFIASLIKPEATNQQKNIAILCLKSLR